MFHLTLTRFMVEKQPFLGQFLPSMFVQIVCSVTFRGARGIRRPRGSKQSHNTTGLNIKIMADTLCFSENRKRPHCPSPFLRSIDPSGPWWHSECGTRLVITFWMPSFLCLSLSSGVSVRTFDLVKLLERG